MIIKISELDKIYNKVLDDLKKRKSETNDIDKKVEYCDQKIGINNFYIDIMKYLNKQYLMSKHGD